MDILKRKDYAEVVSMLCGCECEIEDTKVKGYPVWVMTNFCEEHDPTISHD